MYTSEKTDGSTVEYLSAAETAVLLRKALGKAFPETKFYVRSRTYAGGASIDVYYDGVERVELDERGFMRRVVYRDGAPSREAVEAVAGKFAGGGFDGMIDLAYYVDRYLLPDGSVVGMRTSGTEGSRGTVPAVTDPVPPRARVVSFGAKYVFVNAELPYDVREKKEAKG